MEKPKDYYQLLGVPRDASVSAIKRAFRRLARERREVGGESPEVPTELNPEYDEAARRAAEAGRGRANATGRQ